MSKGGGGVFKLKATDGKNNLCGTEVYRQRRAKVPKMSQRALAKRLQLYGYGCG